MGALAWVLIAVTYGSSDISVVDKYATQLECRVGMTNLQLQLPSFNFLCVESGKGIIIEMKPAKELVVGDKLIIKDHIFIVTNVHNMVDRQTVLEVYFPTKKTVGSFTLEENTIVAVVE